MNKEDERIIEAYKQLEHFVPYGDECDEIKRQNEVIKIIKDYDELQKRLNKRRKQK